MLSNLLLLLLLFRIQRVELLLLLLLLFRTPSVELGLLPVLAVILLGHWLPAECDS